MVGDDAREPLVIGEGGADDEEVLKRLQQKRARRAAPPSCGLNMTPMIDIVFQLIIFFMIVSEFQNMEMEQITLPFALEAKEEPRDGQANRVVVNVNDKGEIRMMRRSFSSEQLKALLIERARNSPKDADGLPMIAVKLRADAECEYKYVQDVIVQCMRAYIWKLSFGASHIDREEMMQY
jgi:biopolymer transport protein ExbD